MNGGAGFDFDVVDFVTSDHHFGHARISELAGRPFSSVEEMNAVMVERWNALVGPDDVVLHLGDLALGSIEQSVALTAQLNGRRLLVPGNHDRVSPATQSNRAVERFRPMYEDAGWTVLPETLDGIRHGARLLASHYPYVGDTTGVERHGSHRPVDTGIPLVHGHTHDRGYGPHASHEFHVGVDAFDFAPIRFELIDAWLENLRRAAAARYCVVALFAPMSAGVGFARTEWPAHVTLVSNFSVDGPVEQIVAAVDGVLGTDRPLQFRVGETALFGRRRDVPVRLVESSRASSLHRALADRLGTLRGFVADDPAHWRSGYTPHLTLRAGFTVEEGQSWHASHIAVARLSGAEAEIVTLRPAHQDPRSAS